MRRLQPAGAGWIYKRGLCMWVGGLVIYTLGSTEVDDVSVFLEHVDLLDGLDGLDVHLLQGSLELLVVGAGGLVDLLDLAAGSALASVFLGIRQSDGFMVGFVRIGSRSGMRRGGRDNALGVCVG